MEMTATSAACHLKVETKVADVNPNAIACAYKVTIYNAIGNSIKSDLNAAREAGLNAILMGERGWAYDKDEVREAKTNLEIVSQLCDVIPILRRYYHWSE